MKKNALRNIFLVISATIYSFTNAQTPENTLAKQIHQRFAREGLKLYLSDDGKRWFKATGVL